MSVARQYYYCKTRSIGPLFRLCAGLDSACKVIAADLGNWTNSTPFDVLRDIAEDLVADGGMHFGRHEDDRISLDIPMTIETTPVPPHLWR